MEVNWTFYKSCEPDESFMNFLQAYCNVMHVLKLKPSSQNQLHLFENLMHVNF